MQTRCHFNTVVTAITKPWVQSPALHNQGVVTKKSVLEEEDWKFRVILSNSEFKACLGCMRPCLKNI